MSPTTRDKIIQAALSSFAVSGYEGTTLAHIAGTVGIKKPSLYNHFSSKAELFLTVAEKVMKELMEAMTTSAWENQKKSIDKRIYLILTDSTNFIFQKHEGMMYKRLMLFPPKELAEDVQILVQTWEEKLDHMLAEFYKQGIKEGVFNDCSFPVFRSGFYCLMDGLFTERFIYPESVFKERSEGAWQVFWRGVSR